MSATETKSGSRILVVDDDRDIRLLLVRELRDLGQEVIEAEDAEAAIAEIARRLFDIVITDIRMPGMDGIQLTEWIKEQTPHTEVIVITGYAEVETAARAMHLGAFDCVTKPFGELEFVTASVNRAIEKQALEKDLGARTAELE